MITRQDKGAPLTHEEMDNNFLECAPIIKPELTDDITYTVGPTGDFTDLQECLDVCNNTIPNGFFISVKLLYSFEFTKQIHIINMDLRHVEIVMEDESLYAEDSYYEDSLSDLTKFVNISDSFDNSLEAFKSETKSMIYVENSYLYMALNIAFTGVLDFCSDTNRYSAVEIVDSPMCEIEILSYRMFEYVEITNSNVSGLLYFEFTADDYAQIGIYSDNSYLNSLAIYVPQTFVDVDLHINLNNSRGNLYMNNGVVNMDKSLFDIYVKYQRNISHYGFSLKNSRLSLSISSINNTILNYAYNHFAVLREGSTFVCPVNVSIEYRDYTDQPQIGLPYTPYFGGIYLGGELDILGISPINAGE